MFTSRLSKYNDKLTYSDRLISNLLIENYNKPENIKMMTSEQIAQEVGCGQATVIRFSQKLGYPTFKSMMMDIMNDVIYYGESEVKKNESTRSIMGKLQNLYTASVTDVLSNNTDEDIDKAVEYLENANTVFCFGIRNSYAMVSLLYYRMLETGRKVLKSEYVLEGTSIARNLGPEDVVIVVSVSGDTIEVERVLRAAKPTGAKIITITGSASNKAQEMSDVALKSAEYNIHTDELNFVNRTSQLFLIDTLFLKLWRDNEKEFLNGAREMFKRTDGETMNPDDVNDVFRL